MADIDAKKVELLPCPFCGSPADIFYDSDNEANVFCTSDDCDAQIFGAKEARCIEKWNRRASLPLAGNVEGDALYLASTLRKWGHVGPRLCEKSADEIDRLLGVIRSLSSRVETEKRAKEEAETAPSWRLPMVEKCDRCDGTGIWQYDSNHAQPCPDCCPHDKGWRLLREHYGERNGKYACMRGCGHVVDCPPEHSPKPQEPPHA